MTRNGPYQYEVALSAADCSHGGTSVSSRSWRIFIDPLEQTEIHLGQGETEDEFLYRQIGVLVVPISLSYEEPRLLASEFQTDGLKCVVN